MAEPHEHDYEDPAELTRTGWRWAGLTAIGLQDPLTVFRSLRRATRDIREANAKDTPAADDLKDAPASSEGDDDLGRGGAG